MRHAVSLFILLLLVVSSTVRAAECLDVFPSIATEYGAMLSLPSYKFSSQVNGDRSGNNLSIAAGQYRNITVTNGGSGYFSQLNAEYRLTRLTIKPGAIAQFLPGDYWIENLTMEIGARISVNASGTVRIFVRNVSMVSNLSINDAGGHLVFVGYNNITIGSGLRFTGAMYAVNQISIGADANITGAITSRQQIFGANSTGNYDERFITNADFDGMCGPDPTPTIYQYQILHDGDGVGSTCAADLVAIRACLDPNCNNLSTEETSVDFYVNGVRKHSPVFIGSVTFEYPQLTAGEATLSIANESIAPQIPFECTYNDCTIDFSGNDCDNSCFAYFPDTMQSYEAGGRLRLQDSISAYLHPDNVSIFPNITDLTASSHSACWSGDCAVTGTTSQAMILPAFELTSSSYDIVVSSGEATIGLSGTHAVTEVNSLSVTGSAKVEFIASDDDYIIDDATFRDNAEVVFNEGTYWFNDLEILGNTNIIINGAVTLYVNGQTHHLVMSGSATVNTSGQAKNLAIISYANVSMGQNAQVKGAIYSAATGVRLGGDARLTGAIAVKAQLSLSGNARIFYEDVNELQVSGICSADPAVLELHFNFDEGVGQSTEDQSSNNRDGTLGNSSTIDSQDPTWTCEAEGFNLTFERNANQHVQTPAFQPPANGAVSFWMKVPSSPTARQRIFGFGDGWEARWESDGIIYWDINKTGGNSSIRTASAVTETDTWVHFTFVTNVSKGTWAVYKNGVLENSGSESLTRQSPDNFTIGGSTWRLTSEHFTGQLEDFRLYSGELTQAQIESLAATPPVDCPQVNHYQIIHDGSGITCSAETVLIKACSNIYDGSCLQSTEQTTLDFLVNGATDNVSQSLTFTGSASVNFNYVYPENITLSITNPTPMPTGALVCNNNAANSCDMAFADSGFIFSSIGTQISAKPSTSVTISAVETDTETGSCQGALVGETPIAMAAICEDPSSCAGLNVTINGSTSEVISTSNYTTTPSSYTDVMLDFGSDANSSATFTLSYPDAGQIKLFARYNLPDPDTGQPSASYLLGNSNSFVVKPYGFHVDVIDNKNAQDISGEPFKLANEVFNTRIRAVAWQTDLDNDLSNNAVTPNFGNERNPEQAALNYTLVEPVGGITGILTEHSSPSAIDFKRLTFSGGQSPLLALKWNEVGILHFDASLYDGQYLSISATDTNNVEQGISGSEPYVGRFIPEKLVQEISSTGRLEADHSISCLAKDWAYIGQQNVTNKGVIHYANQPEYKIRPYGKNDTSYTILNYAKFNRLQNYEILTPLTDNSTSKSNPLNGNVALTAELTDISVTNIDLLEDDDGLLTHTFSNDDHYTYVHHADSKVNKFQAKIKLAVDMSSYQEDDGVPLFKADTGVIGDNSDDDIVLDGVELRFGRIRIENAYGPESSNIDVPIYTEYFNGSKFVINDKDDCLAMPAPVQQYNALNSGGLALGHYRYVVESGNLTTNSTSIIEPAAIDVFSKGKFTMVFSATIGNEQGKIKWEYEVPAWLKFDWDITDADTTPNQNPTADVQLGTYRGNDRIISWRELQ